jgi:hypothetical protein
MKSDACSFSIFLREGERGDFLLLPRSIAEFLTKLVADASTISEIKIKCVCSND